MCFCRLAASRIWWVCQWSGVAMTTASTSGWSIASSWLVVAKQVVFGCRFSARALAASRRFVSTSQTATTWKPLPKNAPRMRFMPRLPGPITARRTIGGSLGSVPKEGKAAVSAAVAAPRWKSRRVRSGFIVLIVGGRCPEYRSSM